MKRHAVVVDDDRDIARLVATYLEAEDFSVTLAHDGLEALERVQENLPDLIVLDVEMPYMDGIEVLRKLRTAKATAQLPVILLTARDQPPDMFTGWQAGADLYVTKPFEAEELLSCVRRVFATQSE